MAPDPLDNAPWHSLVGAHAAFARRRGDAVRYDPEVSVFAALPDAPTAAAWRDLAALVDGDGPVVLLRRHVEVPAGWDVLEEMGGVQLVPGPGVAAPDAEAVALGPADAAEATALVEATRPGPWRPRTIELGGFVGVRREGRLVAMAGLRLRPAGWAEISAVCTNPEHRGQGLAARLVRHVVHEVEAAGGRAFIQAATSNVGAVRLYERLGFARRTDLEIAVVSPGR